MGTDQELLIVTEHFSPSIGATAQLVSDIADDLYYYGIKLRILTSSRGSLASPYSIHRFALPKPRSSRIRTKLFSGLYFFLRTLVWLLINLRSNHHLLIVSNPPFIGLLGPIFFLLRRIPYIFLFQDIFPRSASLTGVLPSKGPIFILWQILQKLVLKNSRSTVVLSDSMVQRCLKDYGVGINLVSIPNWAVSATQSITPKSESQLAKRLELVDTLTVQYSGNFGRLHDILSVLESARLLKQHPIKFLFIGDGAKRDQITHYKDSFLMNNVILTPYQKRQDLCDSLASCDISIVSLVSGAEDTVAPSKLYGILASSRPILLISTRSSELRQFITINKCGIHVEPGDPVALAEALFQLLQNPHELTSMSANSRHAYDAHFGRHRSTRRYLSLINQRPT